jgi:hypothetical protein
MKNISRWLGELKIVIGQAGPYLTLLTILMMAATFYHTTLIEWLGVFNINIPLWLFFTVIVVGGAIFLWLERKYMMGGYFDAWTEQWWGSENEMKNSMKKLQSDMDKIKEVLKIPVEDADDMEK